MADTSCEYKTRLLNTIALLSEVVRECGEDDVDDDGVITTYAAEEITTDDMTFVFTLPGCKVRVEYL